MIEQIFEFFGYVKKDKPKESYTIKGNYPDLGNCKCGRKARWTTHYSGNVCNTCHDNICGLEG